MQTQTAVAAPAVQSISPEMLKVLEAQGYKIKAPKVKKTPTVLNITTLETEWKGSKMIAIKSHDGDKFPFQFGLRKARLVIACIEEIKSFVAKNGRMD